VVVQGHHHLAQARCHGGRVLADLFGSLVNCEVWGCVVEIRVWWVLGLCLLDLWFCVGVVRVVGWLVFVVGLLVVGCVVRIGDLVHADMHTHTQPYIPYTCVLHIIDPTTHTHPHIYR
jgi:hypothetical protein